MLGPPELPAVRPGCHQPLQRPRWHHPADDGMGQISGTHQGGGISITRGGGIFGMGGGGLMG